MPRTSKTCKYKYVGMDEGPIRFYDEKLAIAQSHGFDDLTSYCWHFYHMYESTTAMGQALNMHQTGATYLLKKLGIKLRGRGGANNKGNKARRPDWRK